MVTERYFGCLQDGTQVRCYTITNKHGEYVELLNYGASIQSVVVRDRDGHLDDVVLGAKNGESLERFSFEGGTIGRCANRIAHGRYAVNGKQYQLEQNVKGHFLHGASGNYARKLFDAETGDRSVTFRLHDTGEGGFSCCVETAVTFSFEDDGRLELVYDMLAEDTTILNPTNHAYFNLSGNCDVRKQVLQIWAENRTGRDEYGLPNGSLIPVQGSPADFTAPRVIGKAMQEDGSGYFRKQPPGYDEFYLLDGSGMRKAAELTCPETGRRMEVYTDMPCLVLYVDGSRQAQEGKRRYEGYCAVCLETGFVPNAVNCPNFDSPVFGRDGRLLSHTIYRFGTA